MQLVMRIASGMKAIRNSELIGCHKLRLAHSVRITDNLRQPYGRVRKVDSLISMVSDRQGRSYEEVKEAIVKADCLSDSQAVLQLMRCFDQQPRSEDWKIIELVLGSTANVDPAVMAKAVRLKTAIHGINECQSWLKNSDFQLSSPVCLAFASELIRNGQSIDSVIQTIDSHAATTQGLLGRVLDVLLTHRRFGDSLVFVEWVHQKHRQHQLTLRDYSKLVHGLLVVQLRSATTALSRSPDYFQADRAPLINSSTTSNPAKNPLLSHDDAWQIVSSIDLTYERLQRLLQTSNNQLPLPSHISASIMAYHIIRSDFDAAVKIFDELQLQGVALTVVLCTTVLRAFLELGDKARITALKKGMDSQSVKRDHKFYGTLIHGFLKQRDVEAALEAFNDMLAEGINPNQYLYVLLMRIHLVDGNVWDAQAVWDLMLQLDFKPGMYGLIGLLDGFGRAGYLGKAVELFDSMASYDIKPNVVVYNSMINMHVYHNDLVRAVYWYERMLADDIKPDFFTHNILLKSSQRKNDITDGLAVVKSIDSQTEPLNAIMYPRALSLLAMTGHMDDAVNMNKYFQDKCSLKVWQTVYPRLKDNMYNSLLLSYSARYDWTKMKTVFDEMVRSGTKPTKKTFMIMIRGAYKNSDISEMLHWYQQAKAKLGITRIDKYIFYYVTKQLMKNGLYEKTNMVVSEMISVGIMPPARIEQFIKSDKCRTEIKLSLVRQ